MTSLRQTPETILIRRQSAGAARARRRAAYGPIDDHDARAAVQAALDAYIARHGAPAAAALAAALAGACFARTEPKAAARAAAAALFKSQPSQIEGDEV
jgi:hypothetical protein